MGCCYFGCSPFISFLNKVICKKYVTIFIFMYFFIYIIIIIIYIYFSSFSNVRF